MFALLRGLAILALLLIVYAGFRYARERDPRWLRNIRVVLFSLLGIGVMFGIGLFIERLTLG
ncbi:hypothetical protein HZU75_06140 [Chitinibacter fontanus]|uniref:Uncharacterized protein n=1 Tax=Chitinibacter fontanus TaxID=1737446 RepID=A0A7D5ZG11_9NEIS|nr:hypothetical protein [Chitinibacter fontanus]QLI81147.1 hypothetical protein HZU75_06140 [Chitinibacter fontanus]